MVRDYELGVVINPDLSDDQIEAQLLRLGQTIESREGTVVRLEKWGRRRLAYSIERHRDGYYAFMDFKVDSLAIREIERTVLVQENVLRHLITNVDAHALAERARREQVEANRAAQQAAQAAAAAAQAQAQAQAAAEAAQAAETPSAADTQTEPPPASDETPVTE